MRIAPILTIVVLAAGGAAGYAYWQQQATRVPPGLARANGRIEVERVDMAIMAGLGGIFLAIALARFRTMLAHQA